MEYNIIQTSNQENKGMAQQKERGKQGRSPSSFHKQATTQPTLPKREEEKEKESEETIFPQLQDSKDPKRFHGRFFQHGQKINGIKVKRGEKNEIAIFSKERTLSPDVLNTLL
ncbi:hypothetical protein O181_043775 [Austropuccinia psidii MF-1]|uniref:Uncharacterized protein n=1 Tax=Austropuccinia psidii MF-1 TaxID=1389203 RepID=A0A9Q3DIX9_9BASI|nr:hypothetical protein [Austropuccinia psidii MF-1]